jgi:DNA repair exonuclease SbcCD ATPase subunit
MRIEHLPSNIPGWYDSDYLAANEIAPEPGAYIRSKVVVSTKNLSQQLQDEEDRLRKLYGDCRYYVIPKIESNTPDFDLGGKSDDENVVHYVAQAIPAAARFEARRVVQYLRSKLGRNVGHSGAIGGRFIRLKGTNVLSFPEIEIYYDKQGLVLLKGVNEDWGKRSNGSGKTSLLSLIAIALSGESPKGQKDDRWASEFTDERAGLELVYKTGSGKRVNVARSRRPHSIHLAVDGKDESSGLTGKRKTETQGSIEAVTGYDLDLLLNSVFIDQTITNGFVFGAQKARMDLVNKICNLGRFESALKSVSKDLSGKAKERDRAQMQVEALEEKLKELEETPEDSAKEVTDWKAAYETAKAEFQRRKDIQAGFLGNEKFYDQVQTDADDVAAELTQARDSIASNQGHLEYWKKEEKIAQSLYSTGKCSLCGQPTEIVARERLTTATKQRETYEKSVEKHSREAQTLRKKKDCLDIQIASFKEARAENSYELKKAEILVAQTRKGAEEEEQRNEEKRATHQERKEEKRMTQRLLTANRCNLRLLDIDIEMMTFAQKAMSRSGMPMYLAQGLAPLLNKSAQEYAENFNGGKLSVNFDVVDSEFVVEIYNPTGSRLATGQCMGEAAMAGVVAAFALRDAAPKSNLLIIDEPGHGLDDAGAKQFAEGLLKIRDRWRTIIVCTHNSVIGSILEGEADQIWTVRKKRGRSRLDR